MNIAVDTGRKLNVHKKLRRRPRSLLNVLWTFNLRPVSTGMRRPRASERLTYIQFTPCVQKNEDSPKFEKKHEKQLFFGIQ